MLVLLTWEAQGLPKGVNRMSKINEALIAITKPYVAITHQPSTKKELLTLVHHQFSQYLYGEPCPVTDLITTLLRLENLKMSEINEAIAKADKDSKAP